MYLQLVCHLYTLSQVFMAPFSKACLFQNMTFSPNAELNVFKLCGNHLVVFFPHVDKLLFFAIVC